MHRGKRLILHPMPHDAYVYACETYQRIGVDTEGALQRLASIPISLHCWQGDDIGGFEHTGVKLDGGLAVTGNYPGKARTLEELRADLDRAFSLIPGHHRLNLHACYADLQGAKVERNAYTVEHFQSWINWCQERKLGFDFNPTFFSHPLATDGLTLTNPNQEIRQFWIEHAIACRKIGAAAGRQLSSPCVTNIWIPDGCKDTPIDRKTPRVRLLEALDIIFAEPCDPRHNLDAVESKLFGIGSESYVPGSHEFYLGYAIKHQKLLCLDSGHFHPTETLADKISSIFQFIPRLLLHVSRGVRWDSDHVVVYDDPLRSVMEELVRGDFLSRTHVGLDYFDASINRIGAWIIGMRSASKALLSALLEPTTKLRKFENAGDYTARLAWLEEAKTLPMGAVWDEWCLRQNVPVGPVWLDELKTYEREVLATRN